MDEQTETPNKMETITELERKLITHCEMQWMLNGKLPSPDTLCEKFEITAKKLKDTLNKPNVRKSFEARGIPVIEGRGLTAEQVIAINTVLNLYDSRSERKKLQDMGISTTKWNGWMKDPAFKQYYAELTSNAFKDAIPDSKMALIDNVRRGDLGSIKLYFEMTGVHDPNRGSVDPRELMNKIFEVISLYVKDPATLLNISQGMLRIAGQLDGTAPPVATIVQPMELEEGVAD